MLYAEASKVNQGIVLSVIQMLSVVNQTHLQQVEDHEHILGLERYIREMSRCKELWSANSNNVKCDSLKHG